MSGPPNLGPDSINRTAMLRKADLGVQAHVKECADSKADRLAKVYALDMDPVVARLAIKEDDEATEPRGLRNSTAST